MYNILLQLIDDIELLLKQDKRFLNSNDHLFKNKINKLSQVKSIDITPIINLAKLNTSSLNGKVISPHEEKQSFSLNNLIIQQEPYNLSTLQNLISKLKQLNNTVDKILE
jgi:hypothetical protein